MKIDNIVLGDGLSGLVIAAALYHEGKRFKIYGNGKYKAPEILLLEIPKLDYWQIDEVYTNDSYLKEYFDYFGIEDNKTNRKKYIKEVKVGYLLEDNRVHSEPTSLGIYNYYSKQGRYKTSSSMSNSKNRYFALDLKLVYEFLKDKFSKDIVMQNVDNGFIDKIKNYNGVSIYNTIVRTESSHSKNYEYVKSQKNDIGDYTYVYDCRPHTNIKRMTKGFTEYISNEKGAFLIENYYDEPIIIEKLYPKKNTNWIDISRNVTCSQLKVEDIIYYMMTHNI